jgi:hypothetical protein
MSDEVSGALRDCSRPLTNLPTRFVGVFNPEPLDDLKHYLDLVSERWDNALGRLKSLVGDDD